MILCTRRCYDSTNTLNDKRPESVAKKRRLRETSKNRHACPHLQLKPDNKTHSTSAEQKIQMYHEGFNTEYSVPKILTMYKKVTYRAALKNDGAIMRHTI